MFTLVVFVLLALLQVFVLTGGLEVRAATVKRYAPWFLDTYLRITGEQANAGSGAEAEEIGAPAEPAENRPSGLAGFAPGEVPVHIEGVEPVELPVEPPKEQAEEISKPADQQNMPETRPAEVVDEDIPVG